MRDRIRSSKLLAPNLYVAGTILSAVPMEWYAIIVDSPEAARQAVRAQKRAGYDFIKVHNFLDEARYNAIVDEARVQQIDVVGHVPVDISVRQAVNAGQKTFEHLKGYILDETLTLTKEDYVAATKDAMVWNCPTLSEYRNHARGEGARKLLALDEMRYVSPRLKQAWLKLSDESPNPLRQNILPLSMSIMKDLIGINGRFLAGTDSGGGYPYMVPGFALHEELQLLTKAGLTPTQALRSATVEPSLAMNKQSEFGTIEKGKRADLVLLSQDPRKAIGHIAEDIDGVAVRGLFLSRADLKHLLNDVEQIYANTWPGGDARPTAKHIEEVIATYSRLAASGYVLRTHYVDEIASLLDRAGHGGQAKAFRSLAVR